MSAEFQTEAAAGRLWDHFAAYRRPQKRGSLSGTGGTKPDGADTRPKKTGETVTDRRQNWQWPGRSVTVCVCVGGGGGGGGRGGGGVSRVCVPCRVQGSVPSPLPPSD